MTRDDLNPDIFLRAAELLYGNACGSQQDFACHALSVAHGDHFFGDHYPESKFFVAMLKPRSETEAGDAVHETHGNRVTYWNRSQFYGAVNSVNREARILGLLLCIELINDPDYDIDIFDPIP